MKSKQANQLENLFHVVTIVCIGSIIIITVLALDDLLLKLTMVTNLRNTNSTPALETAPWFSHFNNLILQQEY